MQACGLYEPTFGERMLDWLHGRGEGLRPPFDLVIDPELDKDLGQIALVRLGLHLAGWTDAPHSTWLDYHEQRIIAQMRKQWDSVLDPKRYYEIKKTD